MICLWYIIYTLLEKGREGECCVVLAGWTFWHSMFSACKRHLRMVLTLSGIVSCMVT